MGGQLVWTNDSSLKHLMKSCGENDRLASIRRRKRSSFLLFKRFSEVSSLCSASAFTRFDEEDQSQKHIIALSPPRSQQHTRLIFCTVVRNPSCHIPRTEMVSTSSSTACHSHTSLRAYDSLCQRSLCLSMPLLCYLPDYCIILQTMMPRIIDMQDEARSSSTHRYWTRMRDLLNGRGVRAAGDRTLESL